MVAQAVATIALGLLGASGIVKLIDPDPTTGAMSTAGLPASNTLTRLFGVVEALVAVAALLAGGPAVIAAGCLYAAFAVFTAAALRRELPIQSCGCFGREDTPPTTLHVAYNSTAAVALFALPLLERSPIDWGLASLELVLFLGFAAVGVYASYLLLATLPQLTDLIRNP